ncbi:MAG TPA: undecaprenyldiphospho-muramoylpentapeptide beta-N-acetylglucosaminyltransferase [Ignavibacteria bacterium]|nr:undecaprenyldiphospho-muramoylpentapeptide beta-N-acetylglucosaminyltransferase [Ignavibacteria bacterium]
MKKSLWSRVMKYLFAGGGTGGHIFPAIAIADEIRKLDHEAEILFVGAKGRIEEKIVPQNNYKLEVISISGFDRQNFFKNILLPVKVMTSITQSRKIIRDFSPDVVIGTGGFVCGPVIYTAKRMGIPSLIQEGNSFAGKTIKILSEKSDKVVINFEETKNFLKRKDNIIKISHPVRNSLSIKNREDSLLKFGLETKKKSLFIFGGSQGATAVNSALIKIIPDLNKEDINIIWQTGENDFDKISEMLKELDHKIRILKFVNNMDEAYSAADLIICRAGITSIMEIALLKKAAILIPFPGAAEDHQVKNAMSLKKMNAAEVILQENIEKELLPGILRLIRNDNALNELRNNVSEFSDRDAARKIAEEVLKLANKN